MKKEFQYISDLNYLFFVLMIASLPAAILSLVALKYYPEHAVWTVISCLLCGISIGLYFSFRYLKAEFQANDKNLDFKFRFENLHLEYKDIKKCELLNYPEHSRCGSLMGYKIHLHIIDKNKNEYTIRQYVSADYSFMDYPQGLPEEVTNAELTEIGNFIKSKLPPAKPEKKEISKPETDASVMYTNTANTPEMQEILNAIHDKKYIKKIEHEFTYDFIEEVYQQNLILTLTNDNTYDENDDLKIRFENISDLETNLKGIMPPVFTILDHNSEGYDTKNRYELIENEWDILSFYFEKAEISS